jgi:HEAT repeat protein
MVLYNMAKEAAHQDALSPEIQDVMRSLITAIRAVKLYPPNNPIYSQSVSKSYEHLARFLETTPEYHVGVHKTFFTYLTTPFGKDAALNKAIAQDLFAKEVREIIFSEGISEEELMVLLKALALSSEEMAMKSGISSILWEFGATHIKVVESGLDEVITTAAEQGWDSKPPAEPSADADKKSREKNKSLFSGRTLVLGTLMADPEGFGASMLELAKQTRGENESVEDRLYSLYQEAGQKIRKEHPDESDTLFESLAESVLSLEPQFREGFVAGKLYADLDVELASDHAAEAEEQIPNALQEVQAGRFSNAWTVQQVATLLKKTAGKKSTPPAAAPNPAAFEVTPVPKEITEKIVPDLAYTQDDIAALKAMSGVGMESDIIHAAVRTLIFLIPLVKTSPGSTSDQREVKLFSGVIRQLEELLGYLQKKKDYELAAVIIRAFHSKVDPIFKPRMTEALKKTASKSAITDMIADMRTHPPESAEYHAAYAYLKTLDREGTSLLLDLLAEEGDRDVRLFLITILKDLGKNQVALVGEQLSDRRWYVVRNAVRILGDTKTEQAITFLHKVADHKDVRIREEVVHALNNIGGRKAAGILARYLKDKDLGLQVLALRSIGELQGLGDMEAHYVMDFAELRPLKQRELEHTLEAITVLGKIGGRESAEFLARYTKIRWWKPRKLQEELRAAALVAIEAIKGRRVDAGRAKR